MDASYIPRGWVSASEGRSLEDASELLEGTFLEDVSELSGWRPLGDVSELSGGDISG